MTKIEKVSKKTDPRIIRTRKLLQEATLALSAEKPYSKISISDITERAGVARPTFYLHYKTKDEVIVDYLDGIFKSYLDEITPYLQQKNGGIYAQKLFEQVERNSALLRPLLDPDLSNILISRFSDYIAYVSQTLIQKGIIAIPDPSPEYLNEFLVAGIAGYFYSVLLVWLEKGMPYTPEQMTAFLIPFINNGLTGMNAQLQEMGYLG